jgi:hypothetical protein
MMPPLAALLALLGAGAASADGSPYHTNVVCDSRYHDVSIQAMALAPPGGGYVSIQVWLYSYQAGGWAQSPWYKSPSYPTNQYTIQIPSIYGLSGQYYVEVEYVLYRSDRSYYTTRWDTAPDFMQYAGQWSGGVPSSTCFA